MLKRYPIAIFSFITQDMEIFFSLLCRKQFANSRIDTIYHNFILLVAERGCKGKTPIQKILEELIIKS